LPISALQHLAFCERQCALIHIERIWEENRLTAEGRLLHDRADTEEVEVRGDTRLARAVRLRCLRLGLVGKADVVEFHRATGDQPEAESCALAGVEDRWQPFPVEYKRGKPKIDRCDEVQLCAQALCLEEMLGAKIAAGALFYATPRRRLTVSLDQGLRDETETLAERLHALVQSGRTPAAEYAKRCENCSLVDRCMPRLSKRAEHVEDYLLEAIEGRTVGET
jgi:CRISPR-associated exonuclease Cas4